MGKAKRNSRKHTEVNFCLVALAVVSLTVIVCSGCGGDSDDSSGDSGSAAVSATTPEPKTSGPPTDDSNPPRTEFISASELRAEAQGQKTPLYWAGQRPGTKLALRPLAQGSLGAAFVRYLTGGAEPEDPRPNFLTVVTDISKDPVAALQSLAATNGDKIGRTPNGTAIYYDRSNPEGIFLAFPEAGVQVEVFDPTHFKRALRLVKTNEIVPVE